MMVHVGPVGALWTSMGVQGVLGRSRRACAIEPAQLGERKAHREQMEYRGKKREQREVEGSRGEQREAGGGRAERSCRII